MSRGCVSRLVYAPKLLGDWVIEVSRDDPTHWALKRVRFGTLNTSAGSCPAAKLTACNSAVPGLITQGVNLSGKGT
jgi:hypothetical protein